MNKVVVLLVIGLFANMPKGFSQGKFAEGYIVTSKNDTIHGKIKNRGSEVSFCNSVIFIGADGKQKKYKPKQISAYKINARIYRSLRFEGLVFSAQKFMKLIVEGNKLQLYTLYQQSNSSSPSSPRTPSSSSETIEHSFLRKKNSQDLTRIKSLFFAKQMSDYFSDAEELSKKILNKEYREKDIVEIVKIYNE